MSRQDRVIGGVLCLLGVALGLEATTFDVLFLTDPVGPKALPLLVATLCLAAGVLALARPGDDVRLPSAGAVVRMTGAVVAFLVYAAVLPWLGFFVSTALVVAALARLYQGPVWPSLVVGAVLSGGLWLLFVELLSLPLPLGELWIL